MGSGENFRFFLLPISLIGFVCCLDRSDFNVPLGIFAFVLWNEAQFPQKHRILWVLLVSLLGDLLWILIISVIEWGQEDLQSNRLRGMTQALSILNMVYKLCLVFYAANWEDGCEKLLSCESFSRKVLYL